MARRRNRRNPPRRPLHPFEQVMYDSGVAETRLADLYEAFDRMHLAISKLDGRQRQNFWLVSLEEWLEEFARVEDVMSVVPRPY